jgi:hypothetical protein
MAALALVLCAGCASAGSDLADALWGDLGALFSGRDNTADVAVPKRPAGSPGGILPADPQVTQEPASDPQPGAGAGGW